MTLKSYKKWFNVQLEHLYDADEIKSMLAIVADEILGFSRLDLFLKENERLDEVQIVQLNNVLYQLQKETPIQYVFGKAYFYGYELKVNSSVLIPRHETEELVEWVLDTMNVQPNKKWRVLDIGTGSGCIPITIKKEFPLAEVSAIDISIDALKIAQENANNLKTSITFIEQNILTTKQLDFYDIIISNPPYVRNLEKSEVKKNVLDYEPQLALFVDDYDPLVFYRKITQLAQKSLTKNGLLFFEINQYLGEEMQQMVSGFFKTIELRKDLQGNDRMLKCSVIR